jgi:hypothetical protein
MNFAFKHLAVLIVTLIVGFGALFIAAFQSKSKNELSILPTATSLLTTYDPAYYGLPEVIAGYRILLVETPENMACMRPDTIDLVLQTSQPDLEAFLKQTPDGSVESELKKYDIKPKHWLFTYAGQGITKESAIAAIRNWDPKIHGECVGL